MVDIMDFMGFYFHNKIHNKSTYKIIKNINVDMIGNLQK